jgi:polysaccharide export outer membrane protein
MRCARWFLRHVLVPALLFMVSFTPPSGAEEAYVLGQGDILEIQVWDNKELTQTIFIRPDGKISLPLVGEVQAGGKTVKELQEGLAEAYGNSVKGANVTVIVKEIRSRPIYFIGGFAKPGEAQLTRELTLLQAVSVVGGLLPTADGDNGFILRGAQRIPVNFTKLLQKGDLTQNVKLEVGDSIVAPLADAVYVHGEVRTPGAVKSTGDLTVLKAIAQSGGFTPLASTGKVEILRTQNDKKERIRVDVDKMMRSPNENPDLALKPNDIVFVPQRLF